MAVLYVAAGVNHFINPAFYLNIMPPYLPWHETLVAVSGVAEIVLGIGLLVPATFRLAAWGVIALLIAVSPANIHMALNHQLYPEIPSAVLWIRLFVQVLLILWAYWYTIDPSPGRYYRKFRKY